jgi:hypothetical protein
VLGRRVMNRRERKVEKCERKDKILMKIEA